MDLHNEETLRCSTFDELPDAEYGKQGTPERDKFESDAVAFCATEMLKEERQSSPDDTNTKKSE